MLKNIRVNMRIDKFQVYEPNKHNAFERMCDAFEVCNYRRFLIASQK